MEVNSVCYLSALISTRHFDYRFFFFSFYFFFSFWPSLIGLCNKLKRRDMVNPIIYRMSITKILPANSKKRKKDKTLKCTHLFTKLFDRILPHEFVLIAFQISGKKMWVKYCVNYKQSTLYSKLYGGNLVRYRCGRCKKPNKGVSIKEHGIAIISIICRKWWKKTAACHCFH